jgi:hypothetical protein
MTLSLRDEPFCVLINRSASTEQRIVKDADRSVCGLSAYCPPVCFGGVTLSERDTCWIKISSKTIPAWSSLSSAVIAPRKKLTSGQSTVGLVSEDIRRYDKICRCRGILLLIQRTSFEQSPSWKPDSSSASQDPEADQWSTRHPRHFFFLNSSALRSYKWSLPFGVSPTKPILHL